MPAGPAAADAARHGHASPQGTGPAAAAKGFTRTSVAAAAGAADPQPPVDVAPMPPRPWPARPPAPEARVAAATAEVAARTAAAATLRAAGLTDEADALAKSAPKVPVDKPGARLDSCAAYVARAENRLAAADEAVAQAEAALAAARANRVALEAERVEGRERLEALKSSLRPDAVTQTFTEQVRLVADALERAVPPTSHTGTGPGLPAIVLEALAAVRAVLDPPLPADAPGPALDEALPEPASAGVAAAQAGGAAAPTQLDEERDAVMAGMGEELKRLADSSFDDAAFRAAVRLKLQRRA